MLVDFLPAGFEIETVLRPEDGAGPRTVDGRNRDGAYAWIGEISTPNMAEARDDRFVAAFDVRSEPFAFAYIVRAVTPGAFAMPGAVVEDMYRPAAFARTQPGRIDIRAAQP